MKRFKMILIRKAEVKDLDAIISLIDNDFTKQGYGFVNKAQIETEVYKRRVLVAECDNQLCGCRIGIGTVWNLVVADNIRGQGIGKALIEYIRPHTIRVKADPIGHLSKEQHQNFKDPTNFYEKLGFELWGLSFPKNFWQKGKGGKGQFHVKGFAPKVLFPSHFWNNRLFCSKSLKGRFHA